jgi:hypothetical protein
MNAFNVDNTCISATRAGVTLEEGGGLPGACNPPLKIEI